MPSPAASTDGVARHYDELDHFYRDVWGEHLHHGYWDTGQESPEVAVIQLLERIADAAEIETDQRICDVGSGYGGTARYLADRYGAQVTAMTLSMVQHQYAVSRGDDARIDYVQGDWFDNDFADNSFDVVLAVESTAHMADKPGFFREASRVLRSGGRLIVCAWLADEQPSDWHNRYLLNPIRREGQLPGLGTFSEYERWIASADLSLQHTDDWSDNVRKTWSICLRRILLRIFQDSRYLRFLFDSSRKNRRFALTIPRMSAAYALGALRYGFFVAKKLP